MIKDGRFHQQTWGFKWISPEELWGFQCKRQIRWYWWGTRRVGRQPGYGRGPVLVVAVKQWSKTETWSAQLALRRPSTAAAMDEWPQAYGPAFFRLGDWGGLGTPSVTVNNSCEQTTTRRCRCLCLSFEAQSWCCLVKKVSREAGSWVKWWKSAALIFWMQ